MLKLFPPDVLSTAAVNPDDGAIFFAFLAAILVLPALVVVLYHLMARQFCRLPQEVTLLQQLRDRRNKFLLLRNWRKNLVFFLGGIVLLVLQLSVLRSVFFLARDSMQERMHWLRMVQVPAVIMKNTVFKNVKYCNDYISIAGAGLEVTAENAAQLSGELCALLQERGIAGSFSEDVTWMFVTGQADAHCIKGAGKLQKDIVFMCTAQGSHTIFYP